MHQPSLSVIYIKAMPDKVHSLSAALMTLFPKPQAQDQTAAYCLSMPIGAFDEWVIHCRWSAHEGQSNGLSRFDPVLALMGSGWVRSLRFENAPDVSPST